jgi:glutathione S-transferase
VPLILLRENREVDLSWQEDDGFVLFESRAIARYIAAKANSPLLPTGDAHEAALFDQAESIEISNFYPFASGIVYQRVFAPMLGKQTDEARVAELANTLEAKLSGYEAILSKQKYLAGDEITLADLSHLPHGVYLAPLKFDFLEDEAKFPHVARYGVLHSRAHHPYWRPWDRWWKELTSRPSWLAVKDGISE